MNIISIIKDEDIGYDKFESNEKEKIRYASRGIVINKNNEIAIFNKTNKNEYKLPGGGIEGNEDPEEAFKREVLEETGCKIDIVDYLGTIEEYKSKDNFKQISHVFVGKVIEDTHQFGFTEKEKDEGARLLWTDIDNGLKLIIDCFDKIKESKYESIYHTKFIVYRDRKILEYYLKAPLCKGSWQRS